MLWNEVVSSICICLSALIFSFSLQGKTKIKILFVQMFASILYIMSYLFVISLNPAALSGAITAGFEGLRLVVFYFIESKEKLNTQKTNLIAMFAFVAILTTCVVLTWGGWISILPLISSVIVSLALGSKSVITIKIAYIIQTALIIIYLILMSLWINAGSQIFVLVFGIVGLITFLRKSIDSDKMNEKES